MNIDYVLSSQVKDKIIAMTNSLYEKINCEWERKTAKWFRHATRYKKLEDKIFLKHIGEIYITIATGAEYDSIGYEDLTNLLREINKSNDYILSVPVKEKEVYELDLSGQCCDDADEAGSLECDDAVFDEPLWES